MTPTADSADNIKGVTLKERAQMVLLTLGRTPAEINRAFRHLAKLHHPDTKGGDTLKFKLINEAYQFLAKGQISKRPLLADNELVMTITGRRVASLLNRQKEWEEYERWHKAHFHADDWFYPGQPRGRKDKKRSRQRRENAV
ncbi:MAG: J domain-containing protein [Kiritimatiellia bacterium]